ncbi:MAG: LCP family protein, partial [Bacilli bacterium]
IIMLQYFISYNANKISNSLEKVTSDYTTYSTSLITMNNSKINNINNLKGKRIGIISDKNNVEGYIISKEIIKSNNITKDSLVEYDDFINMLNDLYKGKVDAIFISSSYASLFGNVDGFNNLKDTVKVITSKEKLMKKNNDKTSNKTLTKPFTVLVMGVDSEKENLSSGSGMNGDALLLMTFNPNTMNATILSIPRDTYVPIACYKNKAKSKINAAAYGGEKCMMDTITNFTGINIDYWVKINFKGVVSLVNALGGVDVNVPYTFCEQNSKREWGKNTVFVKKGIQTLNGEQALALSRHRKRDTLHKQYCASYYNTKYIINDFVRGQSQQLVINGIINKAKSIRSFNQIYSLLDVVGNNMDTNIDKETMLTGFDTFKNVLLNSKNITSDDFIGTQKLYLSGRDKMINGVYYFQYYEQSLKEITSAMEINLELKEPVMDKEFSFSINKPYENIQIGKGTYKY